jgi:hypothetical protein
MKKINYTKVNYSDLQDVHNIPLEKCSTCKYVRGVNCLSDLDIKCYFQKASKIRLKIRKFLTK